MIPPVGTLRHATIDTPVGPILVAASETKLCLLEYATEARTERQLGKLLDRLGVEAVPGRTEVTERIETELAVYFGGSSAEFTTPIELVGTPFQRRVWEQLLAIPVGETRSYGQLARALGDPNATRAVGSANGANPLSIVVPCHRVVRTGGALGGYGGGLDRKRWLLDHEARMAGATLFA